MPAVKIELKKGLSTDKLIKIKETVMNTVVNVLQIPENDRNIRVLEYEPHLFEMKPPYEMLIEIAIFKGRSDETKKKLYKSIVTNLDDNNLISKDCILIFINEQPKENWAGRGGISADEMKLEFKVEV